MMKLRSYPPSFHETFDHLVVMRILTKVQNIQLNFYSSNFVELLSSCSGLDHNRATRFLFLLFSPFHFYSSHLDRVV